MLDPCTAKRVGQDRLVCTDVCRLIHRYTYPTAEGLCKSLGDGSSCPIQLIAQLRCLAEQRQARSSHLRPFALLRCQRFGGTDRARHVRLERRTFHLPAAFLLKLRERLPIRRLLKRVLLAE